MSALREAVFGGISLVLFASCARHDPPRPAAVSPASVSLEGSARGEADGGEPTYAWADDVRLERWTEAARGLDALTPEERSKPEIRYVRARVALAQSNAAAAIALLEGLEAQLPLVADSVARYRADAKLAVGPFLEAGDFFFSKSSPGALLKASLAFEKSNDANRARAACDRVIAHDHHTRAQEAEARARRIRTETRSSEDNAADARWLAVLAPDLSAAKDAEATLARLEPGHPLTAEEQIARARAFGEASQTDDALRAIERAGTAPGHPIAPLERMRAKADVLFRSRNRFLEAAKALDECAAVGGPHAGEDALHAARALSRADHDDEAILRYAGVARRYPRTKVAEEATFLGARLHLLHARWSKAERAFDEYARQFPAGAERKEAHRDRALAHFMMKEYPVARKLFEQLAEDEGDTLASAQAHELAALAAFRDGDRTHAVARWTDLARSRPLSWPALMARARLAEVHAPLPDLIETAENSLSSEPLPVALPPPVDMLHRVGLDADAESELRERENLISANVPGRGVEALCVAYGQLGRAKRRFQIAQQIQGNLLSAAPGPRSRWAWECAFPTPYMGDVAQQELAMHLPEGLLHAVMRQESGYDPEVVSSARAVGLLQLLPETARTVASEANVPYDDALLTSPPHNILLGARYLHDLLEKFRGQMPLAIAGYNAGPEVVARWASRMRGMEMDLFVEHIPFIETRGYVIRVMGNFARYAYLRGGESRVAPVPLMLLDDFAR